MSTPHEADEEATTSSALPEDEEKFSTASGHTELSDLSSAVGSNLGLLRNLSDSQVYTATATTMFAEPGTSLKFKNHPLNLEWVYGMNPTLPVFLLHDEDSLVIFYGSAHLALLYNYTNNRQNILKGHSSPISCLCVSEDRRWLVTADKGPESLVIIWDSYNGIPVRTLFDCHPDGGVAAVALSKTSEYLVTVGAEADQRICFWDWTDERQSPLCAHEVSIQYGHQHHICFHPTDSSQLISNSDSHVLFYTREKETLNCSAQNPSDQLYSTVGPLRQSIFHISGMQAFTATVSGKLIFWDTSNGSRRVVKIVVIHKDPITVLTQFDSFIATGDIKGNVKVFDEDLKIVSINKINFGSIASISFSKMAQYNRSSADSYDGTLQAKPLTSRNFVVSTCNASVVYVLGHDKDQQTLMYEHTEALHALTCHPTQPLVAMASYCGLLQVWNYEHKNNIASRVFTESLLQCMTYDPKGMYLAIGFSEGSVEILDALSLKSQDRFQYSKDCITHITFSQDSCYLATADMGKAVTVFRLCHEHHEDSESVWKIWGRHHSHYKSICDILFGVNVESSLPRLLSLGEDRMLVEYDLQNSNESELSILSAQRIEQSSVPTCMAWYPPLTQEDFLLTASSHYKMKLFDSTSKMYRRTLLGPAYGSPIRKMAVLPVSLERKLGPRYMAYITQDKVGLQILPLDGNPFKSSSLIGHPTGISTFVCSYEGKYVFTAGGHDCTVLSWEINYDALDTLCACGGQGLDPFYSLLEGGRSGELYCEMEEYFYFCQLQSQAIDSMVARHVSSTIPLTFLPFMMRALGFFPTQEEVEDMQNEVKFSRYTQTGKDTTEIDLEDFIKLYINHRPVFGICGDELKSVFKVLGDENDSGEHVIDRGELLQLLCNRGERMTEEELAECFCAFQDTDSTTCLESHFPEEITLDVLMEEILGLTKKNKLPKEAISPTGSQSSLHHL